MYAQPRRTRTSISPADGRPMNRPNGKAFLRDQRGGVLAWVALALAMIIASAVGAIDMGFLYVMRNQLQATADAGALAGVSQIPGHKVGEFVTKVLPAKALVTAAALAYAEKNMSPNWYGTVLCTDGATFGDCLDPDTDVVLGHWDGGNVRKFTCHTPERDNPACPQPTTDSTNAVKVTTRTADENANALPTWFFRYFGIDSLDVGATAVAAWVEPPACILALDTDDVTGFGIDDQAVVKAIECSVHINSPNDEALHVDTTSSEIHAESICVNGNYGGGGVMVPVPDTGCPPKPDPLSYLAPPPVGPCDYNDFKVATSAVVSQGWWKMAEAA